MQSAGAADAAQKYRSIKSHTYINILNGIYFSFENPRLFHFIGLQNVMYVFRALGFGFAFGV
jgi:hypothetical protein